MKKITFLTMALICIFSSCKKDSDQINNDYNNIKSEPPLRYAKRGCSYPILNGDGTTTYVPGEMCAFELGNTCRTLMSCTPVQ